MVRCRAVAVKSRADACRLDAVAGCVEPPGMADNERIPAVPRRFAREALWDYATSGVGKVHGWLLQGSIVLVWSVLEVQEAFGERGDVAEIGVFKGKLFILLCHGLGLDEQAVAIDSFAIAAPEGSLALGSAKLFMCRRSHAAHYRAQLRMLHPKNYIRADRFCDHEVHIFDFISGAEKTPLLHYGARDPRGPAPAPGG